MSNERIFLPRQKDLSPPGVRGDDELLRINMAIAEEARSTFREAEDVATKYELTDAELARMDELLDQGEFWHFYQSLSDDGRCESPGGDEYCQVLTEWLDSGKPEDIQAFIISRTAGKPQNN